MVDDPSESSEADDDTKPGRRGVKGGRLAWPRASEYRQSRVRVGAMRSLNPFSFILLLSL